MSIGLFLVLTAGVGYPSILGLSYMLLFMIVVFGIRAFTFIALLHL